VASRSASSVEGHELTYGPDAATVQLTLSQLRMMADRFRDTFCANPCAQEARMAHDAIMHYLDICRPDADVAAILSHPKSVDLRRELIELNSAFHRETELSLARRYLSSKKEGDPFEGSWINKGFPSLLKDQVKGWKRVGLFDNNADNPVIIVVGGGALPQTQVALARELRCNVFSVERDHESAEVCRHILQRIGLEHLKVFNVDGAEFDYTESYLVVVATLVEKKELVARQVANTNSEAVFAPRIPLRLHEMWREKIDERYLASCGWTLIDRFEPNESTVATLTLSRDKTYVRGA
jgi:hypothetical protein